MSDIQAPRSPSTIERHITSVYQSLGMLAGMQLDVFTPLKDGPLSCAGIATALGVGADKLGPLLYVLVNAELLTVNDGLFANTPEADEFLVRGRPRYMGGRHELLSQQWHWAMQTAGSIRDGKARMKLDFARETPERLTAIYRGMYAGAVPGGAALAPMLKAAGTTHLADIGGGPGGAAIGACKSVPGLRATIVDLPNVVSYASTFIAEAGLQDRVSILAGDVVAAPPAVRYDAAVVRAVIQVLCPDDARALLRHVGEAMDPGGHIFILGSILDDSRTSPALTVGFNLTFLNVYDGGLAFTEAEHREWLTEAGFRDIVLSPTPMPGGQSLITARKA